MVPPMPRKPKNDKDSKGKKVSKETLPPIKCKGCGVLFIPKDHREHFHSYTCRESFYQRVYFSKVSADMVCPNCGVSFNSTKPGRQVYCSAVCREEAQKKRKEGAWASTEAEKQTFYGERFATLHKDGFKCIFCGKNSRDGVKLDVEDDGSGGLHTICNVCREGRDFNKAASQQ